MDFGKFWKISKLPFSRLRKGEENLFISPKNAWVSVTSIAVTGAFAPSFSMLKPRRPGSTKTQKTETPQKSNSAEAVQNAIFQKFHHLIAQCGLAMASGLSLDQEMSRWFSFLAFLLAIPGGPRYLVHGCFGF